MKSISTPSSLPPFSPPSSSPTSLFSRHAQDVRQMYEQRLEHADLLYHELNNCKRHLDSRELELKR